MRIMKHFSLTSVSISASLRLNQIPKAFISSIGWSRRITFSSPDYPSLSTGLSTATPGTPGTPLSINLKQYKVHYTFCMYTEVQFLIN